MKTPYNTRYTPPAPVIEVRLALPEEGFEVGPLTALIDSGADASLAPQRYLRQMRSPAAGIKLLRSQWGERRRVDYHLVDIGIGDIRLPSVLIVADDLGDELILGRNALNMLRIILDGPRAVTEISA
jgi:predicted aspartyl protease